MGSEAYMMGRANSEESPLYSDPFKISSCKSPHPYPFQPLKVPRQEAILSSPPCQSPVSARAYNRKDYDYIASFPRATLANMKLDPSETELLHFQEICSADGVRASTPKESHAPLPKFGAWDVEASVERYTEVFDRVREQKRGGSSPARSLPQHLETPVSRLAKELTVAKVPAQVSTHHRKWSSSSWSRCFVAPVTIE